MENYSANSCRTALWLFHPNRYSVAGAYKEACQIGSISLGKFPMLLLEYFHRLPPGICILEAHGLAVEFESAARALHGFQYLYAGDALLVVCIELSLPILKNLEKHFQPPYLTSCG